MAVEFDVKILHPVALGTLLASAGSILADIFSDQLSIASEAPADSMLGDSEQYLECHIDDETVVTVIVHNAGDEIDLGAEGGYWLTVVADRVRNGRSFILALVLAAAAARTTGTDVVDEWLIVKRQRIVSPFKVVDFVSALTKDRSFETAARVFAKRLDIAAT